MLKTLLFASLWILVTPIQAEGSSPRLLVTLGPKCDFTPEDLQNKVGGSIVPGGRHKVQQQLERLEDKNANHLLFLSDTLHNLPKFARRHGYAYLQLDSCFTCALKQLRQTLATIPVTDEVLPRLDPKEVGLFYDLLMQVDGIFQKHNLTYWATCGTLLGAVRHKGMIPWDDDLDVAIYEKDLPRLLGLREVLAEKGLEITYHPEYEFYKISFKDGAPIFDQNGEQYPWTYPFLDIFPLTQVDGMYTYAGALWQAKTKLRERDYFQPSDLVAPMPKLPFGPLKIPVARNAVAYLQRMYGKDWNKVAYVMYSHRQEQFLPKIKVDLINRSPPAYILPK